MVRSPPRQAAPALDSTARHALTAHHFQSDFDAKDFLERVSGNLVLQSKRTAKQYDPKSFISNFEAVSHELSKLQREIEQQMREVDHVAQSSEAQYRTRVKDIRAAFLKMEKNFQILETKANSVGSTAVRVGEQLESIERERMRAADIEDLVEFFLEFGRGRSARLEEMLIDGGPEGQCKAAIITRRLNSIIQDGGDFGASDRAKVSIEQFCERLERDLLDSFDRSYRQQDTTTMASCARALIEFNGGASCVQTYVNQHEFFMKMAETQVTQAEQSYQSLTGINDLSASPHTLDSGLSSFFRSIGKMLCHEWSVISAVFPNALAVMQVLAQRVFAQSIQNFLENMLQLAEHDSQLAYLRVLAACHACTKQLVQDLQQFDQDTIVPFLSAQNTDQPGSRPAGQGAGPAPINTVSTTMLLGTQSAASFSVTLVRCTDDLFVPYIENQRYVDVENRFLLTAFQTLVARFLGYISQCRGQKPKGVFSRTINQLTGSANGQSSNARGGNLDSDGHNGEGGPATSPHAPGAAGEPPSPSPGGYSIPSLAASFANFTHIGSSPTPAAPPSGTAAAAGANGNRKSNPTANFRIMTDVELDQEDTLPSVARTLQLLKVHAEAITRCVELSPASDTPKYTVRLFATLTEFLAIRYLDPALEVALDELSDAPKGSEPDFRTFYTIKACNQIVHLVQCHFQTVIVPLIAGSPSQYRDAVASKNEFTSALEHKLNQLAVRQITSTTTYLATVLAKQKKQDYRPRDEDFQALSLATEPCELIVDFLGRYQRTVAYCFDSRNQEQMLLETGLVLHGLLLEHYRHFTVSVLGGLVVSDDIAKYQEAVKKFHLSELDERFSALRNIGTLFLVRSDVLQSLLDEDTDLGRMDRRFLAPYLQMREDYRTARISEIIDIAI
ncbi:Exocyst complex component 5 [Dimargaris cristalligena]|nr:Exocyst complex component 5 [Dimargaris cristalligena]